MAFLDHILACNRHDPADYRPLIIGGRALGRVRSDIATHLAALPDSFAVTADAVRLQGDGPDAVSRALAAGASHLVAVGHLSRLRGEQFPVVARWSELPAGRVDRAAVAAYGLPAFGVHLNGIVDKADGPHLWIGRRAWDKPVAPGKLDNMVAGGQPAGLSLQGNLVKEAAEEAAIPAELAALARPVGAVSYQMAVADGLRVDRLFLYDLTVPADFQPSNTDGELAEFLLWPVEQVAAAVDAGDDFKFNVNLVLIDFLIRHGRIDPEHADYLELTAGLHR